MSHHCDIQITECIVKKGETKWTLSMLKLEIS
jgi:hypothetical protein